jgi:hypothetical protein
MSPHNYSTLHPVGSAAITAGRVVYLDSGEWAHCDADSSQSATAALRPLGVAQASAAADAPDASIYDEQFDSVPFVAGSGAISEGDLLVCEDGEGGKVMTFDAADYTPGDVVWTVGTAKTDAAAGANFRGSLDIQQHVIGDANLAQGSGTLLSITATDDVALTAAQTREPYIAIDPGGAGRELSVSTAAQMSASGLRPGARRTILAENAADADEDLTLVVSAGVTIESTATVIGQNESGLIEYVQISPTAGKLWLTVIA